MTAVTRFVRTPKAQLLGAGQVYLLVGLVVPNAVLALVRYARRASNSSLVSARAAF